MLFFKKQHEAAIEENKAEELSTDDKTLSETPRPKEKTE